MRLTVLGGSGAWPTPERACGGFLLEHDGFTVLIDPGYGTMPLVPDRVDAVLVSHGHPDHCADLNPLLRARVLGDREFPPLPVHAPPGALDAVLALDKPRMLAGGYVQHDIEPGRTREVGPFRMEAWSLPHHVPNAGLRLTADGRAFAYTGDTGPAPELVELARDADILLAEATYVGRVPEEDAPYLSTAVQAGRTAAAAGVGRLVLTHLWPGTSPEDAEAAARRHFGGAIG
ncbi:MBL fold metallo-hydrolase [Actinomadura kijaniata]|uniref:MBL fold metallo-hydrolase n=1 Tax=Actinomadura kijaniata TaxID=46161 RepID=UPI003F1B28B3